MRLSALLDPVRGKKDQGVTRQGGGSLATDFPHTSTGRQT